jgi:hypothetical protein
VTEDGVTGFIVDPCISSVDPRPDAFGSVASAGTAQLGLLFVRCLGARCFSSSRFSVVVWMLALELAVRLRDDFEGSRIPNLKLARGLRWHRLIKARRRCKKKPRPKAASGGLILNANQKISVAISKKNSIKTIRYEIRNGICGKAAGPRAKNLCLDKM